MLLWVSESRQFSGILLKNCWEESTFPRDSLPESRFQRIFEQLFKQMDKSPFYAAMRWCQSTWGHLCSKGIRWKCWISAFRRGKNRRYFTKTYIRQFGEYLFRRFVIHNWWSSCLGIVAVALVSFWQKLEPNHRSISVHSQPFQFQSQKFLQPFSRHHSVFQ